MIDKGHSLHHKDCKIHFFLHYVFIPHTYSFLDLDHNSCSADRERICQSRPSSLMLSVFSTTLFVCSCPQFRKKVWTYNYLVKLLTKLSTLIVMAVLNGMLCGLQKSPFFKAGGAAGSTVEMIS